ncbi:PepSY domain-containing protein [Pseudomonas daroniae]|uniref:PepSY domain-containing protein n=1 Tax=Phytopseudomonas daroniae TaxID=2487519 RepID=A0A4Q9QK02_9GAMM|nr:MULTISPECIES: PepSY-associated TM helix domain-containing protein [Pseudomonas]TBU76538.1 PepSY domain-containing protein [Pseudomonas daroniae]TBU80917.1 PepSY domain-containing protein [Pseudomonas sp. FRB 228]TBU90155.1 PepSY domain-containing protein [Pseudomonas daroniae]
MKAQTLTQSMAWLHTWAGLIFGWLLFAIFLTGTLAVFDKEIGYWMQPERRAAGVDQAQAAQVALAYLGETAPQARTWNIGLPSERSPGLQVSSGEGRRGGGQVLDPLTGETLQPRETAGGNFFFRFHFTLNMPRNLGIWVVGLAAMAMLATLVSGIVIHKKFFKEFFTFRPAKGARSWLDAHNASAVLVLPFHLMITYTGLAIFYLVYMPAGVQALYQDDRQALFADMGFQQRGEARGEGRGRGEGGAERAPVTAVPMLPIGHFIAAGEAHYGKGALGSLSISNPGRADAQVAVSPVLGNRIELTKGERMLFNGVTGELIQAPPPSRASVLTQRVMAGLHFAQFGGYPMRWLYFLCGLASCAMIATGLVLFTVKRRRRQQELSPATYRLIEALNVSCVAGLGLACVALLWANRLVPAELIGRADWEVRVFFAVWLLSLPHALWRAPLQAWREQLIAAALLCAALPLLDAFGASPWLDLLAGDGMRFWLDLAVLGLGAALAGCAWRVSRSAGESRQRGLETPRVAQVNG